MKNNIHIYFHYNNNILKLTISMLRLLFVNYVLSTPLVILITLKIHKYFIDVIK